MDEILMYLSESRQKALEKAQRIYKMASGNPLYVAWKTSAIDSFSFFDGTGQYPPEILKMLKERGQAPIVVNKVRSMINQASGLEINTRGKFAFRPQSNSEEEALLTKAISHYGFAVQKDQSFSFKGSLRCRDSLICGIGWSRMNLFRDQILYDYVNPTNVIFDADDLTPQLTNMRYVIEQRWYTPEEIKAIWPKAAKQIDDIVGDPDNYGNDGSFTPEVYNRTSPYSTSSPGNGGTNGTKMQVNEVFYKERRKYYSAIDKNGHHFETFDEDDANDLALDKKDIEEQYGTQIMRTVYVKDILLEHAPLSPNTPNRQDFPLTPCVWQRRTSDGVLVGWMEDLKDIQRLVNYLKMKDVLNIYSKTAIIDRNVFHGQDLEEIRRQIARDDAILFKTGDGEVNITPNINISDAVNRSMERLDHEFEQVSGMYRDSLGDATNATSGVAIKQRQIGTSKNLAFGFDSFTMVKEREGKLFLDLLQGSGLQNILVNVVMDDDEKQAFVMNLVRDVKGKPEIYNDIRTLPVDIYVEIVPDYDSSFDEQKATLETLLANPQAPLILQNPYLLKIMLGERHADKIAGAMQQLNQQQNEQQAMLKGGGGMPPPDQAEEMNPTQLGAI